MSEKFKQPISTKEMAFAIEMMQGGPHSMELCAELAGLDRENAEEIWKSERVQKFCETYSAKVAEDLARNAVRTLKQYEITPDTILGILFGLMQTPIVQTKGSILGQIEACKLGLVALNALGDIPELLKGKSRKQLQNFAATGKWDGDPKPRLN